MGPPVRGVGLYCVELPKAPFVSWSHLQLRAFVPILQIRNSSPPISPVSPPLVKVEKKMRLKVAQPTLFAKPLKQQVHPSPFRSDPYINSTQLRMLLITQVEKGIVIISGPVW